MQPCAQDLSKAGLKLWVFTSAVARPVTSAQDKV